MAHKAKTITTKSLPKAKTPDWVKEEDEAAKANAPAPTPKAKATKEPKAPKEPGEGRKPNPNSFRWVAINIIAENPGKSQEELIALMNKAKPGKDGAYWKRRIARAYHLTSKFAMLKKPDAWQVALPAKPAKPAKDEGEVEEA